jgi:hypothetical protein
MKIVVVVFRLEHRRWGAKDDGENFTDTERFRTQWHA